MPNYLLIGLRAEPVLQHADCRLSMFALDIFDWTGAPLCFTLRSFGHMVQVLGVGGGGSNAVNRMTEGALQGVEFWVMNTDVQVYHYPLSRCTLV